ncbi:ABC transporter substrate-binding protein [Maribacter sp. 2210JD10-5]|uniref:ABC transporter substrate-binding protein n=1 Tax=Maribacter sp. 2210JD10-5 TaxID=3386272 RepID=UPI0039BD708E
MKPFVFSLVFVLYISCKQEKKLNFPVETIENKVSVKHAKGFSIEKSASDITIVKITSPWPNAEASFVYALVPKEKLSFITLNKNEYDAIISVPVEKLVVTSTTHIPALESLGQLDKLVGFPKTELISSKAARKQIDNGAIKELGNNEIINTEVVLNLHPDVVIGFGVNAQNKAYETLQRSNIPVVYNGDWTEESPLGKAEWIKFFAPFFQQEVKADSIFNAIETSYKSTKKLAENAKTRPTVLTGGLYKDVWHVAGGKSWMAQFLEDAKADYLWGNTTETGGIAVSLETVLNRAKTADFWLNPSMLTTYEDMMQSNRHYSQFDAFQTKKVYSNTIAQGATGGLLFYELAPQRPDLVLKDLIHIFHPTLLPEHELLFFKPLE